MTRLLGIAHAVARLGAWASGLMLLAAALVIALDIGLRNLVGRSINGTDELAGYALAIATAWGFAYTLLARAHIRIETLYVALPAWTRALLDLLGLLAFTLFMATLAWQAYGVLAQSLVSRSRSISRLAVPLAIPQAIWVAGLLFFVVLALLLLVLAGWAALRRDVGAVLRLIGSRTLGEEIEERRDAPQPPP